MNQAATVTSLDKMRDALATNKAVDASPIAVMNALETNAVEMDAVTHDLAQAIEDRVDAQRIYDSKLESSLLTQKTQAAGSRLPGEDVRTAIAHESMNPDVIKNQLVAEARVKSLTAKQKGLIASMSARQSLLGALREEVKYL